jgi:predicted O-methyltransferase YrrM
MSFNNMNNHIYLKYKDELNKVKKIINDPYIYDMWYHYGFKLNKQFIPLDSNINVYEALFISQCLNLYINHIHKINTKINILEIGLAYGTSSIIMLNQLIHLKNKIEYTIIDPNQTKQWNQIGLKHIHSYLKLKHKNNNKNIIIDLKEEYSQNSLPKLRIKYDFIFIDGSHDKKIVLQDLENSYKLLKLNGLVLLDDVKHIGVKEAIQLFFKKYNKHFFKITIKNNEFHKESVDNFIISNKKNINNPNTMYCYQKIQ